MKSSQNRTPMPKRWLTTLFLALSAAAWAGCSPQNQSILPSPNRWSVYVPVLALVVIFFLFLTVALTLLALSVTIWIGWGRGWRPKDGFKQLLHTAYQARPESHTQPVRVRKASKEVAASAPAAAPSRAEVTQQIAVLKRAWRTRRLALEDLQRSQKQVILRQAVQHGQGTQAWLISQPPELETHSLDPILQRIFDSPEHPAFAQSLRAIQESKQELLEMQRQIRELLGQSRNGGR
ncbi:hypothetical protein ADN00_16965 [Ornatilinea apprima]|uniref:Uncharacterized protein n=1 Tax=Ornatilinea apprima TaxID=1134406 RepID=A0A0P6WY86_9CHLR|nr:hypothetical protein [Ornatilinea apprima]KPL71391.1 hypothetical protein ADN00_16965 [Ornatilinea apprima]